MQALTRSMRHAQSNDYDFDISNMGQKSIDLHNDERDDNQGKSDGHRNENATKHFRVASKPYEKDAL